MSIHHITEIAGGESGSRPSQPLADLLARAGADVTIHWSAGNHGLSREDLDAGEKWMESLTADRYRCSVFVLLRRLSVPCHGRHAASRFRGRVASPALITCRPYANPCRRFPLRNYVMLPVAIEQERLFVAERLLSEIERRHGLPHPANREIHPVIVDRFLTAYLPETRDGEPAPSALEFAFSPSLTEALNLLRGVVSETDTGFGAALYVHDLDTGNGGPAVAEPATAKHDGKH